MSNTLIVGGRRIAVGMATEIVSEYLNSGAHTLTLRLRVDPDLGSTAFPT